MILDPLHFFADFFRRIQGDMVDAERLLELFQTKATVVNRPDAKELVVSKGEVNFEKVNFAYDERKPTIKEFSLNVPGGSTVALVGQSGGGKSTCLKLLFRFYDVQSGSISIDGQDIRDVTLDSLREHVSVVPQVRLVTCVWAVRWSNLSRIPNCLTKLSWRMFAMQSWMPPMKVISLDSIGVRG